MTIHEDIEEGFADIGDARLHYLRLRSAGGDDATHRPPIVLAHGVSDSAACWASMFRVLAPHFDVVAYDARGHGQSSTTEHGYAPLERARDLLALIDALSLAPPILMGHSMGGETTGFATLLRPQGVRALVIEDAGIPSAVPPDAEGQDRLASMLEQWLVGLQSRSLDDLLAHVAKNDPRWPAEDRRPWAEAKLEVSLSAVTAFARAERADLSARYAEIMVPTLLLKADADPQERQRHGQIVSQLDDGQIVHIDGAGHSVRRDEPGQTAYHLGRFLGHVVGREVG